MAMKTGSSKGRNRPSAEKIARNAIEIDVVNPENEFENFIQESIKDSKKKLKSSGKNKSKRKTKASSKTNRKPLSFKHGAIDKDWFGVPKLSIKQKKRAKAIFDRFQKHLKKINDPRTPNPVKTYYLPGVDGPQETGIDWASLANKLETKTPAMLGIISSIAFGLDDINQVSLRLRILVGEKNYYCRNLTQEDAIEFIKENKVTNIEELSHKPCLLRSKIDGTKTISIIGF